MLVGNFVEVTKLFKPLQSLLIIFKRLVIVLPIPAHRSQVTQLFGHPLRLTASIEFLPGIVK